MSEFVPLVCCDHDWTDEEVLDAKTGEHVPTGWQVCTRCHAVCRRDEDGRIDEYEVPIRGLNDGRDGQNGARNNNRSA